MAALAPLVQPGETQVLESSAPTGATKSRLGILVLPALLMFVAFAFIPLIGVLVLSFTDWDGIGAIGFVGGQSWVQVLRSRHLARGLADVCGHDHYLAGADPDQPAAGYLHC